MMTIIDNKLYKYRLNYDIYINKNCLSKNCIKDTRFILVPASEEHERCKSMSKTEWIYFVDICWLLNSIRTNKIAFMLNVNWIETKKTKSRPNKNENKKVTKITLVWVRAGKCREVGIKVSIFLPEFGISITEWRPGPCTQITGCNNKQNTNLSTWHPSVCLPAAVSAVSCGHQRQIWRP